MEETKKVSEKAEKLSYEQLENVCHQLSNQNRELFQKCQALNAAVESINRLDYLLKVLNHKEVFTKEFVSSVAEEIMAAITIPDTPEKEEEK